MDASPAPEPARPLLARRAIAFAIDWSLASFAGDRLAEHLPFAAPRSLAMLLAALGVFAWWFVLESRSGTTPGKRVMGLAAVADEGGRAPARAWFVRALVLTACFGWDVSAWLGHVTDGRVPAAFLYVREGLACGYLAHAAFASSRPGGRALHDVWSGTRIVPRGVVAGPASPPWPSVRAGTVLLAGGVALAVLFGLWGEQGPDLARLVHPAKSSQRTDRAVERVIRERTGLRSRVHTSGDVHWRTGEPALRVASIDVQLPWSAFAQGKANAVLEAALDTVSLDPRHWDRFHAVVHAQRTVVLVTWSQKREYYAAYDSAAHRWRKTPPDHGVDDEE